MVNMPARTASGSVGHASMTVAKSRLSSADSGKVAPDFAALGIDR
jgi:hypothetical protein